MSAFKNMFKVCNKCQRGVGNDGLEAFGKYYHPDCFVCGGCTKSLIKQVPKIILFFLCL